MRVTPGPLMNIESMQNARHAGTFDQYRVPEGRFDNSPARSAGIFNISPEGTTEYGQRDVSSAPYGTCCLAAPSPRHFVPGFPNRPIRDNPGGLSAGFHKYGDVYAERGGLGCQARGRRRCGDIVEVEQRRIRGRPAGARRACGLKHSLMPNRIKSGLER
jgi:hypothetical protein